MIEEKEQTRAKRFAIETIGCRLNQYESEKMATQLTVQGLDRVDYNQEADLYLINTCTVTGRADASCRNSISRATKRENGAVVVVIGCYVDSESEKIAQLNGVDLVVGNSGKDNIAKILNNKFPFLFKNKPVLAEPQSVSDFYQHSRAWVKISDGCNQKCAYCIIPHVRGKLINRPASEIVDEINLLSKSGYHEVVLTGVHIGQYSWAGVKSIAELVPYILDNSNVSRLRLSSIEPQEVNPDLIEIIKKGGHRICRHLHIPLQSGSDRVLRIMHRPYSSKNYLDNLCFIKDKIDGMVVGADIIVGFPGESDIDFEESVRVAKSGLIDYLHVFSYSDRPGTESSEMPDKVAPKFIKERSKILREISDINYKAALAKEITQTVYAVAESKTNQNKKQYWGITDNYLKILLPENLGGGREILKLNATAAKDKYLIGTI